MTVLHIMLDWPLVEPIPGNEMVLDMLRKSP
jgi:hypothetical protein